MQNHSSEKLPTHDLVLTPQEGRSFLFGDHTVSDRPIRFLHQHNLLELGYCHRGSGIFVIQHESWPFKQGDAVIIPCGEVHLARATPDTDCLWTFAYLDHPQAIPEVPRLLQSEDVSGVPKLIHFLIKELQLVDDFSEEAALGWWQTIMVKLRRRQLQQADQRQVHPDFLKISPAIDIMGKNYAQNVSIEDLARRCHLSVSHFRRVFTKITGLSPSDWLHRLRIQMSCSLFRESNKSILTISNDVGYESVSSFHRQFQGQLGTSPNVWRNNIRGK